MIIHPTLYLMLHIIKQFFILGLMSFGGPAAHIGYFHHQFVTKLAWLTEVEFSNIVAISHLLPGPGSSQVGFAIGYHRAGWIGGVAAFIGFTLPSFVLMVLFAYFGNIVQEHTLAHYLIHGLKLLAVIVVVDAVVGMFNQLCRTRITRTLCIVSAVTILLWQSISAQMLIIILSAMFGFRYLSPKSQKQLNAPKIKINLPLLTVLVFLFLLSFLTFNQPLLSLFFNYFQVGSLVFGGGHVVLPLLQNTTSQLIDSDIFLTGYALAQGVPGPMFTLATFLGFHTTADTPLLGALLATLGVFLPGFILLACISSSWQSVSKHPKIQGISAGVNACVVGLLLAALYQPIVVSAIITPANMAVVFIGLLALKCYQCSIIKLIALVLTCHLTLTFLTQLM